MQASAFTPGNNLGGWEAFETPGFNPSQLQNPQEVNIMMAKMNMQIMKQLMMMNQYIQAQTRTQTADFPQPQ